MLKIIRSSNKPIFGRKNNSKPDFDTNNGNKPAFKKNNNDYKIDGFDDNGVEHTKKSEKSKVQK